MQIHHWDPVMQHSAVISLLFDRESGGLSENAFLLSLNLTLGNTTLSSVPLMDLLKKNRLSDFYMYDGTTTTPQCNPYTQYVIIKDVQTLSEEQY
mmetsp:Transcript_47310/g.34599  ORF Transcript_47310/g.34599 Transcript_47310/m.34599 type:complete len:95 (-) Transcript_47310:216-500(-)